MAPKTKPKKTQSASPSRLDLSLSDPGMDVMLRAGIGGLATTLEQFERAVKRDETDLPNTESWEAGFPWEVTSDRISLRFSNPHKAMEVLQPIFEFAFQIDSAEKIINLRPVYDPRYANPALRAQLQRGLMLTFLQHGKSRKAAKSDVERSVNVNDRPQSYLVREIEWYKHQNGYRDVVDAKSGGLSTKVQELPGTLYPGAAVRHNAFAAQTKQEADVAQLLAAYFAPIGTLALSVNRGSAVLLVPDVDDLASFAKARPWITPTSYEDCLIGGIGDAVLKVYARLTGEEARESLSVPSIHAYLFQPTAWATQQKSRVASQAIAPLTEDQQRIFRFATSFFRPQRKSKIIREKRGKKKSSSERTEWFWSVSVIRPLIASNLAAGRPWFENFFRLFVDRDPANGKPLRDRLFFEREGLINMTQADVWPSTGQQTLVRAVHHALRGRYGQIAKENEGNQAAMKSRFRGEYDRWRLAFSGAKTADQFRNSICDLLSRVPANKELQAGWASVLPMLESASWRHARDLSLLALASYRGKGEEELRPEPPEAIAE